MSDRFFSSKEDKISKREIVVKHNPFLWKTAINVAFTNFSVLPAREYRDRYF